MMAAKTYNFPDDCLYTESDEWVRIDGATARIGITDYAQSELSDIVFVELPEVGSQVEAGQAFGVVESVKAVSDLVAPLSGEVVEVHSGLEEHPEWINEEPYDRGWIIAIEPEDIDAVDALLSCDDYRERVEERSGS
jgi:glycine cleavage system H protein